MQTDAVMALPFEELAREFGTPLYIYSMDMVQERLRTLTQAFALAQPLVAYSVKANGNLAILNRMAAMGCGADIVSGGELFRALEAGVPANRILFSGVAKSDEELRAGLDAGIHAFNVETSDELRRLDTLAADRGTRAPFAIRINPDIQAPTPHEYTRTGHATTKFGVAVPEAEDLYRWAASRPHLRARGIDVHIGSQIVDPKPYVAAVDAALSVVSQLQGMGVDLEFVDLGGGFGIPYEDEGMDVEGLARVLLPKVQTANLRLVMEPGRYLVGEAGVLLTRVRWVKRVNEKVFVITDAGMTDLIRPSHYGGYHAIQVVGSNPIGDSRTRNGEGRQEVEPSQSTSGAEPTLELVDVVGPICETGDFLARDRLLPLPSSDDLLAVRNVGAYGFSMASNYNGRPRPAEIMVEGGAAHLVREREDYRDLIRGEIIPPPFAPNGIQDKVRYCSKCGMELGTEAHPAPDRPLSPTSPGERR